MRGREPGSRLVWLQCGKSNAGPRVEDLAEGARKQQNERTLKHLAICGDQERGTPQPPERHAALVRVLDSPP